VDPPARKDGRSDLELIAAINAGDAGAFDALYFRYRDWVARLAYRFTGNREDALDVLQETFTYLIRKFPGFELTAAMMTFLYPVVKNSALAIRRKRHASASNALLEELPAYPTSEIDESRERIALLIKNIPAGQREVLLMRFVDDMELSEIATALEIPLGTVKSRLHNALAALREDRATRGYFQ
jgi:RNA polymerase sigma-70 factor (ECF subfamily)